jgi:hypothetical protein
VSKLDSQRAAWRRIGADKEHLICAAYLEGYSIDSISRIYSVGSGTVHRVLDRHDIERRPRGGTAPKPAPFVPAPVEPATAAPAAPAKAEPEAADEDPAEFNYTARFAATLGLTERHVDVWVGDDGLGNDRLFLRAAGRVESYPPDAVQHWSLRIVCLLREGARSAHTDSRRGAHGAPSASKRARRPDTAEPDQNAPLEGANR